VRRGKGFFPLHAGVCTGLPAPAGGRASRSGRGPRAPGKAKAPGRFLRIPRAAAVGAGLVLLALTFSGPVPPALGEEYFPVYGSGLTQIRVYTDYLCAPCRSLEADMEPLLEKIVNGGKARVVYLDTPMHRMTIVYARYFLCATRGVSHTEAVRVRRTLFAAATAGILTDDGLQEYLRKAGVKTEACDASATLQAMNGYFREDKVKSTPTCVIVTPEGRSSYSGRDDIVAALKKYAR
jgi:protein-disulfide isomerase